MRSCACTDFTRTQLVRRAVAEAGRGLPAIEPGMPLPAGTGLTRRSFLSGTLGLALAVYGADRLVPSVFEDGIAAAAAAAPDARVLVSIFLDGGADAISALFPAGDARYPKLRPKLALPASAGSPFAEDSRLRWHPSLAPLATLHGEGKVTVFPSIGYTSPDQSHFTSRHYWEVGATDAHLRTGWLGRYLDIAGTKDNPLQGISLHDRLQPALATAKNPIASLDGPDRYTLPSYRVSSAVQKRMLEAMGAIGIGHRAAKDPAIRQVGDVVSQVHVLRNRLAPFVGADGRPTYQSPVKYPTSNDPFPRRLAGLAAMLGAGLPLRCVSLRASGMYDTHNDQADNLAQGLKLTAGSLYAFQRDLEVRGLADRVVVHLWSEFGRRAEENGSLGTDHGAGGIGFLVGSRASGRMVGEFPGLTSGLDRQGNLMATSDFRGVYAAILEQWLGHDATDVIADAKSFARPILFK